MAHDGDLRDEPFGDRLRIVPANEASWTDLRAIFGETGEPAHCQCQWFKFDRQEWRSQTRDERADRLRQQTHCGDPSARTTSGLVAYLDDQPAGWCAVEPRTAYPRLLGARVPWSGRDEDRTDEGVWAVTCFVTRKGFRRRGVSRALAVASVDHARRRGAAAVEGYPLVTRPGEQLAWAELYVGSLSVFLHAGFTEVSRPTPRRAVVRVDLS